MNKASDETNSSTTHTTTQFDLIAQIAASEFITLYADAERDGTVEFYGNGKNATHSNMLFAPHGTGSKIAKTPTEQGGYSTTMPHASTRRGVDFTTTFTLERTSYVTAGREYTTTSITPQRSSYKTAEGG